MRLLSILLIACLTSCVVAAPGDNHARENQTTPLWINIPVPAADLNNGILKGTGLTADVYPGDGMAYVQFLTYQLAKLETWILGNWATIPSTPGWVVKFNVLVKHPTKGAGYMITSIDFQKDNESFLALLTGPVRTVGALIDQKIPSHLCDFTASYSSGTSGPLSFNFGCTYYANLWAWLVGNKIIDGFKGQATFTKGTGNGVETNDFVKWAVVRNNKFEKQFDGTVVWADVTLDGVTNGLKNWYPLQGSTGWTSNILSSRLGLDDKKYNICQDSGKCFWADWYGLLDRENTVIGKAQSNGEAVDGTLIAPDATITSTSTMSNNMIWLYGILVGFGGALALVAIMFMAMRYRARGKQVVATTAQHVDMP